MKLKIEKQQLIQKKAEHNKKDKFYKEMKLEIIESSDKLIINQKWFHTGWTIMLIFLCLILLYLTYFIYKRKEEGTLAILLLILFSSSLIISLYYTLAKILNTTTLTVTNHEIRTHHHPIPWLNRKIETKDIEKIEITSTKQLVGKTGTSYITIYSITAKKKSGGKFTVLTFTPIQNYTDIQNIYQKINHFLTQRI